LASFAIRVFRKMSHEMLERGSFFLDSLLSGFKRHFTFTDHRGRSYRMYRGERIPRTSSSSPFTLMGLSVACRGRRGTRGATHSSDRDGKDVRRSGERHPFLAEERLRTLVA
jgi:hypothetical protein